MYKWMVALHSLLAQFCGRIIYRGGRFKCVGSAEVVVVEDLNASFSSQIRSLQNEQAMDHGGQKLRRRYVAVCPSGL